MTRRLLLDSSLARISQSPTSSPVVGAGGLRRVMIKGFPYHLYFKANEDAVRVIVVFHTSRDPKSLVQRLQH